MTPTITIFIFEAMKMLLGICLGLITFGSKGQSFEERVTSASNVGMTINNLGMIGNAFSGNFVTLNSPSAEYPVNSGIEHCFQGGMWIGALINGSTRSVSTSYLDAPTGYSTGAEGFEMTSDVGHLIIEKSNSLSSPNYSPDAISTQDFISSFTDNNITVPGTTIQIQGHQNPLGVAVTYETYNWNISEADFLVILNYEIVNTESNFLDSLYLGLLVNGVVRNVDSTPPGGSVFFSQGGNGYLESHYMSYDFDAEGDVGSSDSYQGQKFLGAEDKNGFHHPDLVSSFRAHFNSWVFRNPNSTPYEFPDTEIERYSKMTSGLNDLPCWSDRNSPACIAFNGGVPPSLSYWEEIRQAGNRSNLISVGPFNQFNPGDTIRAAFAMVYASMDKTSGSNPIKNEDLPSERVTLIANSDFAQRVYNGEDQNFNGVLDPGEDLDGDGQITRFIIPSSNGFANQFHSTSNKIKLVQNPIKEGVLILKSAEESSFTIEIQNLNGKKLLKYENLSFRDISIKTNLPKGILFLKWVDKKGDSGVFRLVNQ